MSDTPPPYNKAQNQDPVLDRPTNPTTIPDTCIAPHPYAVVNAATSTCRLSAAAITARALAENPEPAVAMANALQLIEKTTTTVLTARGIPTESPAAAAIRALVLDAATRKAREIADTPDEPDLASREAARLERSLATGAADAHAVQVGRRNGWLLANSLVI